jgi:hypothetical protein
VIFFLLQAFASLFFRPFAVVSRTNIGFVTKKTAPNLLTPTHEGKEVSSLNAGFLGVFSASDES